MDSLSTATSVSQVIHLLQVALEAVDDIRWLRWQKDQKLTQAERFELSTLHHQLQFGKTKINRWKELWFIGNHESEVFFMKLWGEDGQDKILSLLSKILQDSSLIIKSAKLIVEERQESDQIPQIQHRRLLWFRKHLKHDKSRVVTNQPKTIMNVIHMQNYVTHIIDSLHELWENAEWYFRQLHPPGVFSDLVRFRSIPTALYEVLKRQDSPLYLDLRLLDNAESINDLSIFFRQQEPSVSFHCICKSSRLAGQAQHLLLKTKGHPSQGEVATNAKEEASLVHSLQLSKIETTSQFSFRLPIENSTNQYSMAAESFASNMFEEYRAQEVFFRSLSTKEGSLRSPPLTLQQKFSIASQLAEATLMLLGTPWLDNFSSESIRCLRNEGSQKYLCLYIDPKESRQSTKSLQFHTIQQRQIFTLGLLLLEIALETPIHQRWQEGEDPGNLWHQYQLDYNRRVERAMGAAYGKACEFCFLETVMEGNTEEKELNSLPEGTDDFYDLQELVEGYHSEVFTRLRECKVRI